MGLQVKTPELAKSILKVHQETYKKSQSIQDYKVLKDFERKFKNLLEAR